MYFLFGICMYRSITYIILCDKEDDDDDEKKAFYFAVTVPVDSKNDKKMLVKRITDSLNFERRKRERERCIIIFHQKQYLG